jgi:hypothetical protein
MLDALLEERGAKRPLLWYYTPMALEFSALIRRRSCQSTTAWMN